MKHTKTLAAKLGCVRIIVVVETRRFMTCFSISQSLNGCGLLLLFHAFAISRLFNLYFRQVFPISFVLFPPQRLLGDLLRSESVCCCCTRQCAIKINSTSLFFNSNFICLFMLFAGALFIAKLRLETTNNELKHYRA